MLELTAANAEQWQKAARAADERASRIGGTSQVLTYDNTDHSSTIEFLGYEYVREPSAISGALMTRYDDKHPQVWRIPLLDEVKPAVTVTAPRGGYVVPAAYAQWLLEKLALHGIEFRSCQRRSRTSMLRRFVR